MTKTPPKNSSTKSIPAAKQRTTAKKVVSGLNAGSKRSSGTQRILDVTLSYEMRTKVVDVPRKHVASLSGLKASTFPVTISGLKAKGLIEYDANSIRLTDLGRSLAKYDVTNESVASDNTAALAELKKKHKLQGGGMGGRLMDLLQDGRVWDRADAAKEIGCENKASLAVLLCNLKKNGIIDYDRHTIKLADMCFPYGRPEPESAGQPQVL